MANGDVRSLADAAQVRAATGVDGVMCARGMLENPAMFAGENGIRLHAEYCTEGRVTAQEFV